MNATAVNESVININPLPKKIVKEIADKYHVSVQDIKGDSLEAHICKARHEAMFRLRTEADMSSARIAKFLCRADHSVINRAIKRYLGRP